MIGKYQHETFDEDDYNALTGKQRRTVRDYKFYTDEVRTLRKQLEDAQRIRAMHSAALTKHGISPIAVEAFELPSTPAVAQATS